VERSVAVLVGLPDGIGRATGDPARPPPSALEGGPLELAAGLRAYAAEGIGHVQLVLDPITERSIAAIAPVLEALDRA
jgi:hypothetical protein